ncbi:PREDICTED: uncharacterized protein DDB_G0271670-like, partial [Drosophila arizonae]|uniref:Uncharacterized protein DDB_G0271670-like n=1 Tax=Drosophila arizonae TaxID=7263 RepID=A0ABM1PRH4_DROAR
HFALLIENIQFPLLASFHVCPSIVPSTSFHWQLRTQTVPSTPTPAPTVTATATATASASASATFSPSYNAGNASRRPVLSVRRRIINTPTAASEPTTQVAELATTSKYNRLRSRPDSAAATAITTTTATTSRNSNSNNNNNNSYFSKLKSSSATLPLATLSPATSSASNINASPDKQHKFQAASYALRRQFQTRRLPTTSSSANGDDSVTDVPRTQNPLFKRRLTLGSTPPPPRSTTTALSIETTTFLYGIEDDDDQVARSSIHTSRFNQIAEQLRPLQSSSSSSSTSTSTSTTTQRAPSFVPNGTRHQLIPRPRRPQSSTPAPTSSSSAAGSPPAARRQQSRRRPHKYIEVYNRPPSKLALATATATATFTSESASNRRSGAADYDSSEASPTRRRSEKARKLQSRAPKVIVHGQGIIECRDQGNFPHPLSCRKFISCAKFDGTGGIVGWEYTCPKGLGYDGDSGMCTFAAASDGRACRD